MSVMTSPPQAAASREHPLTLGELESALDELSERVGERLHHALSRPAAVAFVETLRELTLSEDLLEDPEVGRRAAMLVAPMAVNEHAAGPLLEAGQAGELLKVQTRSAVHDLARRGRLLAVKGPGRRVRFPAAQFAPDGRPWPVLAEVIAVLRGAELDDWEIAAWLTAGEVQPELEGMSPAAWLSAGRDPASVALAARRTAHALDV